MRELYVQVKDRTADGGVPTPEQLLAEKKALKVGRGRVGACPVWAPVLDLGRGRSI